MQQAFGWSGWDTFVWPQWLPVRLRLPLIAQITAAVALTALVVGPWWASIPDAPVPSSPVIPHSTPVPLAKAVPTSPAVTKLDAAPRTPVATVRPAHLNLDVRHTFSNVDLQVTVDGKPVLDSKLEGSGKRFKMFGKRSERGFTQTLDLEPGVRIVRVTMRSAADKFDQTRTERFELGSSSIAAIRIAADKSGMTIEADHPPPPPAPKAPPAAIPASVPAPAAPAAAIAVPAAAPAAIPAPVPAASPDATQAQAASAVIDLVQSLRSMLIAIAGFVASAATGFVVQEFMRRRRGILFAGGDGPPQGTPGERRRRRRAANQQVPRDAAERSDGGEPPA